MFSLKQKGKCGKHLNPKYLSKVMYGNSTYLHLQTNKHNQRFFFHFLFTFFCLDLALLVVSTLTEMKECLIFIHLFLYKNLLALDIEAYGRFLRAKLNHLESEQSEKSLRSRLSYSTACFKD